MPGRLEDVGTNEEQVPVRSRTAAPQARGVPFALLGARQSDLISSKLGEHLIKQRTKELPQLENPSHCGAAQHRDGVKLAAEDLSMKHASAAEPRDKESEQKPLFIVRMQLLDQAGEHVFYQKEDSRFENAFTLKLLLGEAYTIELHLEDLIGTVEAVSAVEIDGRLLPICQRAEWQEKRNGCRKLLVRVVWSPEHAHATQRGHRDELLCILHYLHVGAGRTRREVHWCTQLKMYETRRQLEKRGWLLKGAACRFEEDKPVGRWSYVEHKA